MIRTLVNLTTLVIWHLLISNFRWKSNLDHKSRIFEIVVLNTKWKDWKSRKKRMYGKFYVHEIAAVNLSTLHFLKNKKKTCKPNNRDLNRDRIINSFSFKSAEKTLPCARCLNMSHKNYPAQTCSPWCFWHGVFRLHLW